MSEQLTMEPTEIRAGERVVWTRSLPAYLPADGWALRYRVLWTTPMPADIATVANGAVHRVELSGATTATYRPGPATLVGWVDRGSDRVTMLQQPLRILPDLASATSLDGRTDNQRALEAARSALAAYVSGGNSLVEEYEILGRRMRFRSLKEAQDLVAHYERAVARDTARTAAAQGVVPGRIYTRF